MAKGAARATFDKDVDEFAVMRELLPFIWPRDRRDLRIQVVFAFFALIIAKLVTVVIPVVYKAVVDQLTGQGGDPSAPISTTLILATPVMLILAYGWRAL